VCIEFFADPTTNQPTNHRFLLQCFFPKQVIFLLFLNAIANNSMKFLIFIPCRHQRDVRSARAQNKHPSEKPFLPVLSSKFGE
jgi:hypothetical protein